MQDTCKKYILHVKHMLKYKLYVKDMENFM